MVKRLVIAFIALTIAAAFQELVPDPSQGLVPDPSSRHLSSIAFIEGRWRVADGEMRQMRPDHPNLEITRCGDEFCGRSVRSDGSCGPVVLTVSFYYGDYGDLDAPIGYDDDDPGDPIGLHGSLKLGESSYKVSLSASEEDNTFGLDILEWSMTMQRTIPIGTDYVADGPARCPQTTS